MKKISLSVLVLSLVMTVNAQVDGFFPQFGQDAQWSVNEQFELVFTGAVAPAPAAAIGTTFEGLVSDGIGNNDFTGLNIKFDGIILDAGTSTKVFLAYEGTWGGNTVILEFNQWLCQAALNYGGYTHMLDNYPDYQAAVVKDGYNAIEINVDAAGLIQCKVNNYVCNIPYQAPIESLKPNAISTYYALFANDIAGFKMKNLVVTKGDVTNKYFYDPFAVGVDQVSQENIRVYPNPFQDVVQVSGATIGAAFKVVDITGKTVQSGILDKHQSVNLSGANSGIYMVVITDSNDKTVRRIIKK